MNEQDIKDFLLLKNVDKNKIDKFADEIIELADKMNSIGLYCYRGTIFSILNAIR